MVEACFGPSPGLSCPVSLVLGRRHPSEGAEDGLSSFVLVVAVVLDKIVPVLLERPIFLPSGFLNLPDTWNSVPRLEKSSEKER